MISIFFNREGYYIAGDGVEAARCCDPATTTEGDPIFQEIHHTYKVLYLALKELSEMDVPNDVMVYGDNRIIDEINGTAEALDPECASWQQALKWNVIPSIRSVVFFRKKPCNDISDTINEAHGRMLNVEHSKKMADRVQKAEQAIHSMRAKRALNKLRENWFKHGK